MNAEDSRRHVLQFLASWDERDVDRIMSFFAPDAVYHNVPVAPIVGTAGIRRIFEEFLRVFSVAKLEVVTTVAEPDLVIAERIDRFVLADGRQVTLPVTGVFVLRDRRIARFSDYFDLASVERQSGLKL